MKALLDTSLLVAALVEAHPRHEQAFPWLLRIRDSEVTAAIAAHSIAETYSVLSSLPVSPRITPSAAWALIEHSVLPFVETVDARAREVQETIRNLSRQGITGGVVFDALIAAAGLKVHADCIVTFNIEDFRRVVREGEIDIREP